MLKVELEHENAALRTAIEAHENVKASLLADNTALEAKLSKMEEAISDFWVDRDIWDFDERGVPDTWYPIGAIAEELAKALLDAHLSAAEEEA